MAELFPSDITPLHLSLGETSELRTLDLLRRRLPADYAVYHSVHWSLSTSARVMFGEADFVIINRSGEVVIIEQKAGRLEDTAEGLAKRYDGATPKLVAPQIHRNQDALRKQFLRQTGHQLTLDYLFYCPDHRLQGAVGAGLSADRVVDATEPDALPERIMALLPVGTEGREGTLVRRFFENLFHLVPDIHAHVRAGEQAMARIPGGGLAGIVAAIEMNPMRLRVRGTAGSGKSVAALACVAREVAHGRRPLLVCFNRPLAERLRAAAPKACEVTTFYGLLDRFLASRGQSIDFSAMSRPGFWGEVQERVILESVPDDWRFDTLIVDEGQDFDADWFDMLRLFLKEAPHIIWFEDRAQDIRRGKEAGRGIEDAFSHLGFVTFNAQGNYRTPQSIAIFIRDLLPGLSFEARNPLPGLGVGEHHCKTPADVARRVGAVVTEHLKQGLKAQDIVVLSLRGLGSATLAHAGKVGAFTLARPTGIYDPQGNQIMDCGQIRFDTIFRFKGQEANAVIITDVPPLSADPTVTSASRLLFTALTRAKVRADILYGPDPG
ncbi:MAG: ATP-dependent helicase [Pseudomonadota bacterium]